MDFDELTKFANKTATKVHTVKLQPDSIGFMLILHGKINPTLGKEALVKPARDRA